MIRAITFDFWDTLAIDDSDEPTRLRKGFLPKSEARKQLIVDSFRGQEKGVEISKIEAAYEESRLLFRKLWHEEQITQTVVERFLTMAEDLNIEFDLDHYLDAITEISLMEVETPPEPVPGAIEIVKELSEDYELGIVSDTIFTPGDGIRAILSSWGILNCFSVFSFSDELGCSKPSVDVFSNITQKLDIHPTELVHIGDRYEKDVFGAHQFGAGGILFTGAVDRSSEATGDPIICDSYSDLKKILKGFDK